MKEYSFTAKELEEAISELISTGGTVEGMPITFSWANSYELWEYAPWPLTFKSIGEDKNVTVHRKEIFPGEEGGDHNMFCILTVGYSGNIRYFRKTGEYNSWDTSEWDGALTEVQPKKIEVTQWADI